MDNRPEPVSEIRTAYNEGVRDGRELFSDIDAIARVRTLAESRGYKVEGWGHCTDVLDALEQAIRDESLV